MGTAEKPHTAFKILSTECPSLTQRWQRDMAATQEMSTLGSALHTLTGMQSALRDISARKDNDCGNRVR